MSAGTLVLVLLQRQGVGLLPAARANRSGFAGNFPPGSRRLPRLGQADGIRETGFPDRFAEDRP
jgi:hypothetical protein